MSIKLHKSPHFQRLFHSTAPPSSQQAADTFTQALLGFVGKTGFEYSATKVFEYSKFE